MGSQSSKPTPTVTAPSTSEFAEGTKFTKNPCLATRHDSILSTIGATPLVKLRKLAPAGVDVFVKCEAFRISCRGDNGAECLEAS